MITETNSIDYGIYLDHKKAFVISTPHGIQEALLEEDVEELKSSDVEGSTDQSRTLHLQNRKNELLQKFCKTIIGHLNTPNKILIFGPSESKFELQKEIRDTKGLKHVVEELKTTDTLDRDGATEFVKQHYHITAN